MEEMRLPGPDHPIELRAPGGRTRARFQGHVIADSAEAIMVEEAGYKAVCYFPRDDVDMAYFGRTARQTHCPYKGRASYFTLRMEGAIAEDAAWSYEDPYPAMDVLRDRIAFYPHPVEVYRVDEPRADFSPDAAVLHTDAGEGTPQEEKWPSNVDTPAASGQAGDQ